MFRAKLNAIPLKNVKEFTLAMVRAMSGPCSEHNWYIYEEFVALVTTNEPIQCAEIKQDVCLSMHDK